MQQLKKLTRLRTVYNNAICIGFAAVCMSLAACSSVKNTDVGRTPIGGVMSGETSAPDDYIDQVTQQNAANTRAASENKTFKGSHEYSNFDSLRNEQRD